ncbi:MAG: glycerol-3-phosphate 1-O-acyltransferase PlsB, partial [Gammaproteobacteria bacterium]
MHWLGLDKAFRAIVRRLMFLWVRTTVLPDQVADQFGEGGVPLLYALERESLTDMLVLDHECLAAGKDRPCDPLPLGNHVEPKRWFPLRIERGWRYQRRSARQAEHLARLVSVLRSNPELDVHVIPVAVFWGRAPDRTEGLLQALLSEDWAIRGRVRKFFSVLVHGRNTLVQFSAPLSLRQLVDEELPEPLTVRKLRRILRVHYRRLRIATIGPDLSHRRTMVAKLLETREVRRGIDREMRSKNINRRKATARARAYANEIAANFSYQVILIAERLLTFVWQRLYDGVVVGHFDNLKNVVEGNEIVYVPCHRSHIDYLLLSYVVYKRGFVVPHIAAGINLNLPVLGQFLRGGGAFFLRRSFRGNQLYSAVFNQYLSMNLAKGVPLEYFIEGGRSRTGRLLPPRPGMLSMTVSSYLVSPRRPIVFVPVYFGYERLIEGRTYIGELSGKPKAKESVFDLVRFLPTLKENFGRVHVNFGEPLKLDDLLDEQRKGWRTEKHEYDRRPPWLSPLVEELGIEIQQRVNAAAAVGPVNLLGLVLLATPRQAMLESDLIAQLELYKSMLRRLQYSPWVTVSAESGAEIIAYGEKINAISRRANPLGDVIHMGEEQAVLMTYYRNNVMHTMALPALLACCFVNNQTLEVDHIRNIVKFLYPYLAAELFIRWSEEELASVVSKTLAVMAEHGLLRQRRLRSRFTRNDTDERQSVRLAVLARLVEQSLERFYVVITLLRRRGSGQISEKSLGEECSLLAQRQSLLFGLDSPEFFDRSLFRNLIQLMKQRGVLDVDGDGNLTFGGVIEDVDANAG